MRYAITFITSDNWESVDTVIVDDREDFWAKAVTEGNRGEQDAILVKVLKYYGWGEYADAIVRDRRYFIRNCDDIDASLTDTVVNKDGEEVPLKEID